MKWHSFSPLAKFIITALLLLPLCFVVWYWFRKPLSLPIAWLSDLILTTLWGQVIDSITLVNHQLEIVTRLVPPGSNVSTRAALVFEINPLLYSYSVPFASALILATPSGWRKKIIALCLAYVLLLIVQTWGVCFHVAKTLMYQAGPEIQARLDVQPAIHVAVGLGYQFGYLILPSLSPLVIWIVLFRDFVFNLAPQLTVWGRGSR